MDVDKVHYVTQVPPRGAYLLRPLTLALALVALVPTPALACGGFFCMRSPMDQAGERILFIQDGYDVTAHVQVKYQGEARKFSWVVPTPTEPKLGVGSETLFTQLDQATRPQWQLEIKDLGGCEYPRWELEDRAASAPSGAAESQVQVVSQAKVGPYDSAVIRSNDPAALKAWLRKNGYEIPPKLDPLLDPYVAGRYYFVALKLQQDRGSGDLQPVTLTYRATKPGVPIRLTAVAATPDMDLYVWYLGADRAIPENYRHAKVNEARVDWLSNGGNYREVVTKAANEAGGQAFVTDYAGKSDVMSLGIMDGKRHDTARLARLTDPVRFLRAVQDDGYFLPGSTNALAFVRRYVPIPKHMKDVWEPGFYSNPEQYAKQLAGVKVDAAKAAAELEETVVRPFATIRRQFSRHPYLTRMYTTMSPEEMTQDPMFRTSAILPDVSNVHTATGVRDCRRVKEYGRAPITITLQDGTRFTVDPSKSRRFFPESALPAALVVEQLSPDRPPSIIADHRAEVTALLADAPAEQPAFPAGAGGAGGAGLAAIALGFLGWRRWRTKP